MRTLILAGCVLARTAARGDAQCCGDCNGAGAVSIDELIKAVNHALTNCADDGICSIASCPAQLATCEDDLAHCQSMRYNLAGQLGTCASTAAAAPTLTPWGLLVAALLLTVVAGFALRYRMRGR